MIKVLVAEDSATVREHLVQILQSDPLIAVVGVASNGVEAVEKTRKLRPDLVTMDINMPEMDGFRATKEIMIRCPTPIVIVSGAVNIHDVSISMQALRMGALALVEKPVGVANGRFEKLRTELIRTVKAMAGVKTITHWPERETATVPPAPAGARPMGSKLPEVVAIAASTGGPQALSRIFGLLPAGFPLPILLVQHIGDEFRVGFAEWLDTVTGLAVRPASAGMSPEAGTIYVATGDHHLTISPDRRFHLSKQPAISGFRPSATALFESVSAAYGAATLAVVLTGMGEDGAAGLAAVKAAGGRVIAQDEASAAVYGMPAAAVASGFVDMSLPPADIAALMINLAPERRE